LLSAVAVVLALTAFPAMGGPVSQASAAAEACTISMIRAGLCDAATVNNGESVDVAANRVFGEDAGEAVGGATDPTHTPTVWYAPDTGNICDTPDRVCLRQDVPAEPVDAGFPAVTLADLVSFRPAMPQFAGEPAGFGVVRMPTNFVAAATAQDIPGVLLGYPVTVRFVPVAYVFDYGDGRTLRTATGGVAWAASGSPQFTPTDTSHVYQARGTYVSSVTTEYSAAVDFGAGWRPVDGVVTARTGDYPVQVVEVRTALVAHTCAEDPHGPGC